MRYYLGQIIDHYTLLQFLGKGPFTEVYLGENRFAEALLFAVKTPAQASIDAASLLERRYRILSRLNHTSIVTGYLLHNPEPVLRLDYAPGRSLQDGITAGNAYDLSFVITSISQIAEALEYAHNLGIVHGNLKPQNILFGEQDQLLLSDFDVPYYPFAQSKPVMRKLPYSAPIT